MEAKILAAVLSVAQRHDPALRAVTPEQTLLALGVDSMDLAQLVATLEIETGLDPFATHPVASVRTVRDLCDVYTR